MKWFKHITTSLDDPFIFELIDKYGSDGYTVYFGTIEIMAREFDIENPGKCRISAKYLRKKLQLSVKKVSKILNFCSEKEKIYVKFEKSNILLNCPKLKEMTDEYTQKMVKKIGTQSGQSPPIEEEEDKEEEYIPHSGNAENFYLTKKKRKLTGKRLDAFERFWIAFDYKKDKASAADSWVDIPLLNGSLLNIILMAAKKEAENRHELIKNGQTPKMAQGWLSSRRWEDENYNPEPEIKKVYVDTPGDENDQL